jgi:ketosteroid isomerase-like protein
MPRCALLLAALLAGCSLLQPGGPDDPLEAAADQLLKTDKAFAAAAESAMPNSFERFLAKNATRLMSSGAVLEGREAILASMAAGTQGLLSWEPRFAEVFEPGDWGYTWGDWRLYESGAGGRRVGQGQYVTIWRKQDDGSWEVRLDMGGARH